MAEDEIHRVRHHDLILGIIERVTDIDPRLALHFDRERFDGSQFRIVHACLSLHRELGNLVAHIKGFA
jgi:hypothetical protein